MNRSERDDVFVFETDGISVSQWRGVMDACQAYETHLLDGCTTSEENFALQFPSIDGSLLIPELRRIREELCGDSSVPVSSHDDLIPQSERYLILDEIRSGGMGQVFRAFDRTCGRLVALKRIRREFADEPLMRRRFLAEVELTADLEHPGVIPIYDQSVDPDGREFYVMRLIHGDGTGTLQQAIDSFHSPSHVSGPGRSLSWDSFKRGEFRKLIEAVLVVADTTAHAHSQGIAHRDLKPSNVLVGPYGETLIADWGLAKRINSSPKSTKNATNRQTASGSNETGSIGSSRLNGVGTPGFQAPETQLGSATANLIAADVYSLGAILDCVITGSVRSNSQTQDRKVEPPLPKSSLPLIAIASKAMSTDAADRYENAQSICNDLRNWLAGEPVSAYPESLAERIWNWPSRNWLLAAASGGAVIIALIGSGFFSWLQMVQKEQMSRALQTVSSLLEENKEARKSTEDAFAQRESLALHAISEFQSLLMLDPRLQSDPQFRLVREKVLLESRSFYESLAKSVEQAATIDDDSMGRLCDAAFALVLLENELGNFSDALRVAESACQRLRDSGKTSDRVEYHLGRLLAFKGNIATRNGFRKQGQADQEEAVRHLEPLLDSNQLPLEDRKKAASLWSRAASPMAIGLAAQGDFASADTLLKKILSTLNSHDPESLHDLQLKIQSYGNLALVRYYSKDIKGTYEALEQGGNAAARYEKRIDATTPRRDIVEFEVLRGTLVRFQSDLMLTEGNVDPAIALQRQSLSNLTRALDLHPGNAELQNAYQSCSNRLQAVLREHGRPSESLEVAETWLQLARQILQSDETNHGAREFLLLAHHSMGHLKEMNAEPSVAEQHYREALSIADGMQEVLPAREGLLMQAIELHVHLIRSEIMAGRPEIAESHFDAAIQNACRLKDLPERNDAALDTAKKQLEAALLCLDGSEQGDRKEAWTEKLRAAVLGQLRAN